MNSLSDASIESDLLTCTHFGMHLECFKCRFQVLLTYNKKGDFFYEEDFKFRNCGSYCSWYDY